MNNYNQTPNGAYIPGFISPALVQPSFAMPCGSYTPLDFINRVIPPYEPSYWFLNGNLWHIRKTNGQTKPVADIFITCFIIVNPRQDNTFDSVLVQYTSNGQSEYTVIPYGAYVNRKTLRYFKRVHKYPDCSDKLLEDLLYFLMQQSQTRNFLIIPSYPGWYISPNQAYFITKNDINPYLESYHPDSIKRRDIPPISTYQGDILEQLRTLFSPYLEMRILLGIYASSLLYSLFSNEKIESQQVIVLTPSENMNEKMLTAIMKTQNYDSLVTQSLDASRKEIINELECVNDGIALFSDNSEITDEKEIRTGLDCIMKDIQHTNGKEDYSHHIICIISRFADRYLSWENVCQLSFDNVEVGFDINHVQKIMGQFASYLINWVAENFDLIRELIHDDISEYRADSIINSVPIQKRNLFILLSCTSHILWKLFGYTLFSSYDLEHIGNWLKSKKEYLDVSQIIIDDFAAVVNSCIRNNLLNVIQKTENTIFEKGTNTVISMDGSLCFDPETIEQLILPQCSNKSKTALIDALKACNLLYATNRNRHPVRVYNSQGVSTTIHSYSIRQDILDADNQKKINNLANEEFFFETNERPRNDFLPLVLNYDGRIAGKLIRFRDEENNHIYVTGQSGYGKTFLLSQLTAWLVSLNHKIIIFDSSNSFTYEAICRNLSKEFVDNFVSIHSLEEQGIPIDLFNLDDYPKAVSKKKVLAGILSASTDELSATQLNKLKTALSGMLSELPDGKRISPEDILGMFDEEDTTHASLISRFSSVFEDIDKCSMPERTWSSFLETTKKVIILKTETTFTESGNQLFDMLLATLYNYQVKNHGIQLNIIIDEVQNQNLAKGSPISKILKEGRKLHMAFIGATQAYHTRGDRIGDTMNIADTKIFLKPTPDAESAVASVLDYRESERNIFHRMERGQCLISCNFYSKEKKQNCPAIINGTVVKFYPAEPSAIIPIKDTPRSEYYGNAY